VEQLGQYRLDPFLYRECHGISFVVSDQEALVNVSCDNNDNNLWIVWLFKYTPSEHHQYNHSWPLGETKAHPGQAVQTVFAPPSKQGY
jgi:hypothetical protein